VEGDATSRIQTDTPPGSGRLKYCQSHGRKTWGVCGLAFSTIARLGPDVTLSMLY
jgi:hypothetical protein